MKYRIKHKSEWPLEEPLNWNDNMDYLFGYVLSEEENHIVENTFHGDFLFQKGMFSIHKYHLSEIKDGFYEEDFNIGDPVQSVEIGQHWFYDAVVVEVRGSTRRNKGRKTNQQTENELRLAIVTSILDTRIKEREEQAEIAETKAYNQKIMDLIAQKQETALGEKSIDELRAMLK